MIRETWLETDLMQPVDVVTLRGVLFAQDDMGNRIGVTVKDGGQEVTLAGDVTGYAIRADGATVAIEGYKDGNRAWIDLPEQAYAIVGDLSIVIRIDTGEAVLTLCGCQAYVQRTQTDAYVDSGSIIPSIAELIELIEDLERQTRDYENLVNKPQIGGVELIGNKSLADLGIQAAGSYLTQAAAAAGYVAKETGKGLSEANFTASEKAKLAEIEAGAQANVIEAITVNGVAQPVQNATVDIPEYTGASAGNDGVAGAVPVALAAERDKYLRGDGAWATPTNTTYLPATAAENGLMSAADKAKLDGVEAGAQENVLESVELDGTALPISGKAVDIPTMTGADASNNGTAGAVPAPAAGDQGKYLRGDGTWQTVGGGGGGGASYNLIQSQQDGHTITLTGTDGTSDTVTIPDNDTTYSAATQSDDGLMSAADKTRLDGILGLVYPVGSIYMSVNSADPGTLFGGTWQRIQDTFLLAAGSTYSPGDTGGSASHSIAKANLPSGVTGSVNFRGHNGTGNLITSASGVFSSAGHDASSTMPTTAAGSSNKHYTQLSFNLGGSGTPLDTMPPYLAVYVWQRTA